MQRIIKKIPTIKAVTNDDGEIVEVTDDIKNAFMEEIISYKDSDSLSHEYDRLETDNYIITEELVINNNAIDIRITTNDLGIAAKHHHHITSPDKMLIRYKNYLDNQKETAIKK